MKVLVCDDHQLFIDGLRHVLSARLGPALEFHAQHDARQALALVIGDPDFDVILLDLLMPGLDGFQFLAELEARRVPAPVIVVSASEDPRDIHSALRAGALGYISKSLPADDMINAIEQVLGGRIFEPPAYRQWLAAGGAIEDERGPSLRAGDLGLGSRQVEVLELLARGLSNQDIAATLFISQATVKSHLYTLYRALDVGNRTGCVWKAAELGLIDPPGEAPHTGVP